MGPLDSTRKLVRRGHVLWGDPVFRSPSIPQHVDV